MTQELVNKWIEITGQQPPRSAVENNYYQAVLKAYEEKDVKTLLVNYHLAANNLDVVESDSEQLKIKLHQCELANYNLQDQLQTLLNQQHNQEVKSETIQVGKGSGSITKFLYKQSESRHGGVAVLWSDSGASGELVIDGKNFGRGESGHEYGYDRVAWTGKSFSGETKVWFVEGDKSLSFKSGENFHREGHGPFTDFSLRDDGYLAVVEDGSKRAQMK